MIITLQASKLSRVNFQSTDDNNRLLLRKRERETEKRKIIKDEKKLDALIKLIIIVAIFC